MMARTIADGPDQVSRAIPPSSRSDRNARPIAVRIIVTSGLSGVGGSVRVSADMGCLAGQAVVLGSNGVPVVVGRRVAADPRSGRVARAMLDNPPTVHDVRPRF